MNIFTKNSYLLFSLFFILNGVVLKADTYFTSSQLTYTYDFSDGSMMIEYLELEEAGIDDQMIRATLYYLDASGQFQLLFDRGYNSQWPGTTNNTSIESIAGRTSGDKRYRRFKWKSIPTNLLGRNITLRFDFDWDIDNDQSWGGNYDNTFYNAVYAYSIGAPYSVTASQNECNAIQLEWINPDLQGIDNSKYSIYIYRNDLLITNNGLSGTTTTYTDSTPADGTTYNYYIRTYLKVNLSTHINNSGYVVGNSKSQPVGPISMTLAEKTCNGEVIISWTLPDPGSVSKLVLDRNSTNNFNNPDATFDLSPNSTLYADAVNAGQEYFYRLRALNDCGEGEGPEVISSIEPSYQQADIAIEYVIVTTAKAIYLSWGDLNCYQASEVKLERRIPATGAFEPITLDNNAQQYIDKNVLPCIQYEYTLIVKSGNSQITYTSDPVSKIILGNIDDALSSIDASKGYFSDKVIVNWEVLNEDQIETYKIYRRPYGGVEYTLVQNINNNARSWIDETTEANKYYEYKIVATATCGEVEIESNEETTVGFRQPRGTVTGQISYEGGTAVQGVKVLVNSNQPGIAQGTCLELDGQSFISSSVIPNSDFSQGFTAEAWYNYTTFDNFPYVFRNEAEFIFAYFVNEEYNESTEENEPIDPELWFYIGRDTIMKYNIATKHIIGTDTVQLWKDGTWNHISLNYSADTTKIFINGRLALKSQSAILNDISFQNTFGDNVVGFIDEVRFWNRSLSDEETWRYHRMITSGIEPGLITNYHFDEGIGKYAFDSSKSPNGFNGNHGKIDSYDPPAYQGGFSDLILDATLLSRHAYTDAGGSYVINGIPYRDEGELFRVTPVFGQHSFDPPTKTRFIGDGEYVHNEVNFTDISSFQVQGRITYANTDFPVEGVTIKVDGTVAVGRDNLPITTSSGGEFNVSVPIGEHYISVEKNGHVFNEGIFPGVDTSGLPELHEFNEAITGMEFYDNTKVLLAGRIVGGTKEGDKKIGFELSENNIGPATVKLVPVKPYSLNEGTFENNFLEFSNDDETGEYAYWIIPEEFNVESVSHSTYSFSEPAFLAKVDLRNALEFITETDSVFQESFVDGETVMTFDSVRTYDYHLRRDWIYRAPPSLDVSSGGTSWLSDEEFELMETTETTVIPLRTESDENLFPFPVFTQLKRYPWKLWVFEEYINSESQKSSTVNVTDAKITISNNIAEPKNTIVLETNSEGMADYTFIAGFPNTSIDENKPENSFTLTASMVAKTGSGEVANWPESGDPYRAYIMGGYPTGNNFITAGPNKADYILRDPPGSGSYATLEKGATTSTSSVVTVNNGVEGEEIFQLTLGYEIETQAGTPVLSTTTKIESDNSLGISVDHSETWTDETTITSTTTFTESYSTSDQPDFVGDGGDVFIGHSTNMVYGLSSDLRIAEPSDIPVDGSKLDENYEVEVNGKTLTIGVRKSLRVNPSFNTFFLYSQKQIIDNVIPNLKLLRNLLFTTQPDRYQLVLTDFEDEKYATNNDDSLWGDDATTGDAVHDGMSYKFIPFQVDDENWSQDSVRFYNNQINNWEGVLAANEKQKLRGVAGPDNFYPSNISFDAGVTYEGSVETSGDTSTTETFEWTLNPGIVAELGYAVNGFGFKRNISEKFTHNESTVENKTEGTTQTIGFTLSDADEDNYFTVDVLKCTEGNGPIFRTKGGQSTCPYEGESKTQYYQPGTILNQATVQIENPVLNVDIPFIAGVPEDEPAIFRLNLRNQTDVVVDRWFLLKTDNASNPDGAKLFVDGAPLSSFGITIYIPAGQSITKTLEVFKGAPEVNDYEGIRLQLLPICEVDDTLAEAEAEIGVNFVAACSKVIVDVPSDNWIANVYNNDTIEIKLNGYNVNLSSFKSISLQAKDVATPTWTTLNTYYKIQADYDADMGAKELIGTRTTLNYKWDIKDYVDRDYEIRAVTTCVGVGVSYESDAVRGVKDTKRPGPFGAPQPSDGVLSSGDEVLIQFDEPIISGLLLANKQFVTARGVLNGTDYPNNTSIEFDGNNDKAIVGDGILLGNTSFTVEGWVRHNANQEGTFWSLGETADNQLKMSFDASGKIVFQDGGASYTGTYTYQPEMWYHIALIYDIDGKRIMVYQDDKLDMDIMNVIVTSFPTGRMSFGYNLAQNSSHFNGRLRDFRIWNRALPFDVMYARKSATLSGNEPGLNGYWFMDEKFGNIAADKSHLRHAVIDATWNVEPKGKSVSLSGSSFVTIDGRNINIDDETDFTIEFWFNGQEGGEQCLLSSGRGTGDEIFNKENSIAINASATGIQVMSNGKAFQLTSQNLLDNNWHHLALVVNRRGSARGFIDGNQVSQADVAGFGGIGVDYIFLGARRWKDGNNNYQVDRYFDGALDEVRFWKSARTADQIATYKNHRVSVDEVGFAGYYPFEKYELDNFNVLQLIPSLEDQWPGDDQTLNGGDGIFEGTAAFHEETPNLGLERPVKNVKFDLVVNDDRVLISIDEELALIENTLLEFSIRDIFDMHNNILASPVHWSAFVDKNQIKWETNSINLTNEIGTETTFTASIRNFGGVSQSFFIDNLPEWLTANPSSGSLNAQASTEITFTISEALNTGTFNEDIYLVADNGVNERLALTLKVFRKGPDWEVFPEDYEFSMSVIGILKINDVISRNPNDIIAVFKDGELRGVSNLIYIPQKDEYMVFLDIYGDAADTDAAMVIKVWNDNLGQINTGVQILDGEVMSESIIYKPGIFLGSTQQPVQILVGNMQEQSVPYVAGWNWISINLKTPDQSNTNLLFKSLDATEGDVVKSQPGPSDIYSVSTGWFGQLGQAGFDNISMYLLKLAKKDTLIYSGVPLNPAETPITLYPKWNWIGYVPNFSLPVSDALSNLIPEANDVIKGQRDFAIFDEGLGDWIGSLKSLKPSAGYKYYSNDGSIKEFTYPNTSVFGRSLEVIDRSPETSNEIFAQAYESNMNLIAVVEGLDKYAEKPWIVAIRDGQAVGSTAPVVVSNDHYYFLTIYGNLTKEELTFSLVFPKSGNLITLEDAMIYESDKLVGTIPEPYVFTLPETTLITENRLTVWPIPYSESLNVSFLLKEKGNVRIDMYDIGGRRLGKIFEGIFEKGQVDVSLREHSMTAFEQIPGLYMLKVTIDDTIQSSIIIKQ